MRPHLLSIAIGVVLSIVSLPAEAQLRTETVVSGLGGRPGFAPRSPVVERESVHQPAVLESQRGPPGVWSRRLSLQWSRRRRQRQRSAEQRTESQQPARKDAAD